LPCSKPIPERQKAILIGLVLIALTLIVYWQVQGFDFVYYDDQVYVTENTHVKQGLTWDNVKWAFTATECGFYQPLTWLTYFVDYELYGLKAGGYHWTNLLFHLVNTVLLFWCLNLMTGSLWRSGFVAALFALHPLHVESVAWIAERKDVVSGFFWMLTIGAYYFYTRKTSVARYLLVLVIFVLGLMAKPMAITLPFVLLLLDYWPIGRINVNDDSIRVPWILLEKLPLIAVSVVAGTLTVVAEKQVGALKSLELISIDDRLANAVISYVQYLWRMIWPVDLAIFYPYPAHWHVFPLLVSGLILLSISLVVLKWNRAYPYLAIGWLWFLGTMVPVIGIVQVGIHASADRYTYIPLIGLFVAIVWMGHDFSRVIINGRCVFPLSAMIIILIFSYLSWKQVHTWRNAELLFRHALYVTNNNFVAHNSLGAALARKGKRSEALHHYKEAIHIRPDYPLALFNIGTSLAAQQEYARSVPYYIKTLRLNPTFVEAYNNLGISLVHEGKFREAISYFREALRLRPDYNAAQRNLLQARMDLRDQEADASSPGKRR
jgi:tetratricopeptide (TPR) repeat protein